MVFPTWRAAIGDVAHATWRASAVGVSRCCKLQQAGCRKLRRTVKSLDWLAMVPAEL